MWTNENLLWQEADEWLSGAEGAGTGAITKEWEDTFRSDGYAHHLDWGTAFLGVHTGISKFMRL